MLIQFLFLMIVMACALYDLVEFRIPNGLTSSLVGLFAVWIVARRLAPAEIAGHLIVGLVVLVCSAFLFRFRLLGGGDVKLLAATCLWAGPNGFLAHLLLTSLFAVGVLWFIVIARWLYTLALATVPRIGALPAPRVFQRGAGIPYGIAIAASAVVLGMPRAF